MNWINFGPCSVGLIMTVQFSSHDTVLAAKSEPVEALPRYVSPKNAYRSFFKPALDLVLILIAAPIVVPIVLLAALLISLDGHNPFYSQFRVGQNGRVFRMWKLRTMVYDADERLEAYLAADTETLQEWNQHQKLRNDPRITFIGRILRKSSLDELPQLLNVAAGHMSLVGPRPMMVSQRKNYPGTAYYNLRPGITGLWQVSERNNCEFSGRAYYDDIYDKSVNFVTDLRVLLKTIAVVLRGTGY